MKKYPEYNSLDLHRINKEYLACWEEKSIFKKSIDIREGCARYTFYEGPPSANGLPGIHHVLSRTIKDIFCRYKTQKGFQVKRKAGWDTHGLPVELSVEQSLGITKEDIGKKITIEQYNEECRKAVMKYKDVWDDLTKKMGFWLDLDNPYITYDNRYIESVWWCLKQLYDKGLLYKDYAVQPFSPAAGTGLSAHELNMPGCYRNVRDVSVTAQFKVIRDELSQRLFDNESEQVFFLAWTTTPWTLPSNCALAVGEKIIYVKVKTFNRYTHIPVSVILAKELISKYFSPKNESISSEEFKPGVKDIPYRICGEFSGRALEGICYEQLLPYVKPAGKAFCVIAADFVSTTEGTGIVHTASVFGADDFRVCREKGISSILVKDEDGNDMPLVDKQGKFVKEVTDFAGRYVREEFYDEKTIAAPDFKSTDTLIAIKLKTENKAFLVEKHEHTYPHCWRTDKPVLYYPLDAWFIRTTAVRERLIELNRTINWKPAATGSGRFGNWLENLVDWNLSRSRFWGTPLPVWVSEDKKEIKCIGSLQELRDEVEKAVAAGFMKENLPGDFDLHRPFVDRIVFVSPAGRKMHREPDLIDVWFDSGAMPYAQNHYPFEELKDGECRDDACNVSTFPVSEFPADFIAEGVDQTRGWFFTLHALAGMLFDNVAFRNVVSNGLVLDKDGNKMSKRLGNAVDPFKTIEEYGADATRWYMITNAQPWDNLKFDIEGVKEVRRKFFGTLYNTYAFFALYANIDGFCFKEKEIPVNERPELDRWISSLLNSLIREVDEHFDNYEPTKAGRAIQDFVVENLSNWYVRLSRRKFWKGNYEHDKISAYQTLYKCLVTVAQLSAPLAPFFSDSLFNDLNGVTCQLNLQSVHLTDFPVADKNAIDVALEQRMRLAQDISSMVLSLRKKNGINVRQPLSRILMPMVNKELSRQIEEVKDLILMEVNVKEISFLDDDSQLIVKKVRPNYKRLGPRLGKNMKALAVRLEKLLPQEIISLENGKAYQFTVDGETFSVAPEDVEIISEDIPGWTVAGNGNITVALDITLTKELKEEGIARELVNRIQNLRKEKNFEVTDKIRLLIESNEALNEAVINNKQYICTETLASSLDIIDKVKNGDVVEISANGLFAKVRVDKISE